ncbi:hypothetical protein HYN59_07185 [Flavobacterium album]|uniref:Uncharacterized protein n=1 Tax=Flavobacterium album TaxID=2175091 RepID=A0A2S1QWY9_9FLAO|nr:hypothetical protein HYN59_07185 [Flavobacterium album]
MWWRVFCFRFEKRGVYECGFSLIVVLSPTLSKGEGVGTCRECVITLVIWPHPPDPSPKEREVSYTHAGALSRFGEALANMPKTASLALIGAVSPAFFGGDIADSRNKGGWSATAFRY